MVKILSGKPSIRLFLISDSQKFSETLLGITYANIKILFQGYA